MTSDSNQYQMDCERWLFFVVTLKEIVGVVLRSTANMGKWVNERVLSQIPPSRVRTLALLPMENESARLSSARLPTTSPSMLFRSIIPQRKVREESWESRVAKLLGGMIMHNPKSQNHGGRGCVLGMRI